MASVTPTFAPLPSSTVQTYLPHMQETLEQAKAAPAADSSRDHPSFFGLWFWAVILLLVIYPLSTGPAVRINQVYPASRPVLEAVYKPLELLADISPPIGRLFKLYFTMWGGR